MTSLISALRRFSVLLPACVLAVFVGALSACPADNANEGEGDGDGGGDEGEGASEGEGVGVGEGEGAGEGEGEGAEGWTCDITFLGDGSCDCGCGVVDTDCSSSSPDVCEFNDCEGGAPVDPVNNALCTQPPAGWTCLASQYTDGFTCDCGCGIADPDCPLDVTRLDCVTNNCDAGQAPSDADVTGCVANPAGWTCDGLFFGDGFCDCGCSIDDADDCASPLTLQVCNGSDLCPSGQSPDPRDPNACIENAPQDDWTCAVALILDGACDCGCGGLDPDCANSTDAGSCAVTHCSGGDELVPTDTTRCQENCNHTTTAAGTGTCTNGGTVSFGGACNDNLSACGDGHSYEVECDGSGTCVCRVDGQCILRADGFCGSVQSTLDDVCGWSLIDGI